MDRLKFVGDTLGDRHRNYNISFQEITTAQSNDILTDIDPDIDDVNNLLKVDLASRDRNVEYILRVLTGNDLLYVARAIKQCPWLITDDQYAHIINPEHLHSQLFPHMMAKAANKLLLHIRLNLRDEGRVETFFNYYENLNVYCTALKWLPHCSAAFMETKVEKFARNISANILKRLCKKNPNVLKLYVKHITDSKHHMYFMAPKFQATMFLLNTHTNFYLDLVESCDRHGFPNFNAKCTHFMMKACPERIRQNFKKYARKIDIPTFVKFLPSNDIGDFLLEQAKKEKDNYYGWINYHKLQYFIQRMPQLQRFEFITDVFISKNFDHNKDDFKNLAKAELYRSVTNGGFNFKESFHWFRFAPFNVALKEIKATIKKNANDKNKMLDCLIQIASREPQQVDKLLQYYHDSHDRDICCEKYEFVRSLCTSTSVLKYNKNSWNIFSKIIGSTCLFKEECRECLNYQKENQICVQAVIIHKVINNEEVPKILMEKFDFNILNKYQGQLNSEDKLKLFDFFYTHILQKLQNVNFADDTQINGNIDLIKAMLTLLNKWNKNLADYTYVRNKIKELTQVEKDELSWIFNVNKTWRKCMFEESIIICPSEKTCINALKHDPSLLSRNEKEVSAMRCNDSISLRQLLRKLKIYWPQSLAFEWAQAYRGKLEEPLGHKALMRGLTFLLPHCELIKIINHYKPEDAKISWTKDDEIVLSLRKHIAKNIHFARPQPDPDMILQYAKGDYLQYALGSLYAIFYNLCAFRCRALIPLMLDAPVSLQKHGIRLAFTKMQSEDLILTLGNHWKTSKNVSIRAVTFKLTYKLLCKEQNPENVDKIWSLLNIFIDTLTFKEDKTIYELLYNVETVPLKVKPFYLMKSYTFLKSLFSMVDLLESKHKVEQSLNSLIYHINDLILSLEPEFVANILKDYISAVYTKETTDIFIPNGITPLMVSFLLYTESENIQIQRYEMLLVPVLEQIHAMRGKNKKDYIVMKRELGQILHLLRVHLRQVVVKNMNVPVTVYANIQRQIEESLSGTENYETSREWKLTAAFANILNESKAAVDRSHYEGEDDKLWDAVCTQAAPKFSHFCVELLKEDMEILFPCIYEHFSKALKTVLDDVRSEQFKMQVLSLILKEDVTQTYLVTILLLPYDSKKEIEKLYKVILSHPSLEVNMHCYNKNKHIHGFRI